MTTRIYSSRPRKPMTPYLKRATVCISGFLQEQGSAGNGITRLWSDLYQEHANPLHLVQFNTWDDSPAAIAELLWRYGQPDMSIIIIGYSWGGHTAVQVCNELRKRGLGVEHLFLCDPVYRPWCILGRWRSMLPGLYTHRPPDTVEEVTWYYQDCSYPRGHKVEVSTSTTLNTPIPVQMGHTYIDNHKPFHEDVKCSARR